MLQNKVIESKLFVEMVWQRGGAAEEASAEDEGHHGGGGALQGGQGQEDGGQTDLQPPAAWWPPAALEIWKLWGTKFFKQSAQSCFVRVNVLKLLP